jgi:hypothetical protein
MSFSGSGGTACLILIRAESRLSNPRVAAPCGTALGPLARCPPMKGMMQRRLFRPDLFLAGLCGLILAVGGLWGWNQLAPRWGLSAVAAGSSVTFSQDELQAARRQVRDAATALDNYLGSSTNGVGWRRHLRLEELRHQVTAETAAPDQQALKEILELFSQSHAGLEQREFASVRTALSTYLKVLSMARDSA